MVESASDEILARADTSDVAFLVVGDPFGYDGHASISIKCITKLISNCKEPPLTPTSSSEPGNSRCQYKASTMLL